MLKQSSLDRKADPAATSQEGIAAAVRRSRVPECLAVFKLLSPFSCFLAIACTNTSGASQMRVEKIGVNRDSAHERRRLEIYALNTIMCASEDTKLQQLIKQHADELERFTEPSETARMLAIAALPDSDDDKYQSNSPRFAKTGVSLSTGAMHKV